MPVLFEPLGYAPAYLRVSEAIRARILRRELQEGEPLPTETELARQFEVNRSTVREALRKLESAGLLGRRGGGKRLFVTRPTRESVGGGLSQALALHRARVVDVWEALQAVQPGIAAAAAERRSEAALAKLAATARRFAVRARRARRCGYRRRGFLRRTGRGRRESRLQPAERAAAAAPEAEPRGDHRPRAAGAFSHRGGRGGDRRRSARAGREGGCRLDVAPRPRFPPRLRSRRDRPRDRGRGAAGAAAAVS